MALGLGRFTHSHVADGFKVFLDALAVGAADLAIEALGAITHEIEHAAAFINAAHLGIHLGRRGSEEELLEDRRGSVDGRNSNAIGSDGERTALRGQGEALIAGLTSKLGRKGLIHRDGVFQIIRVIGIRRASEHDRLRLVSAAASVGMAQAADHREVIA
jgi:hypothetical protein